MIISQCNDGSGGFVERRNRGHVCIVAKSNGTGLCTIGNKSRPLLVGVIEGGRAKPFFVYIVEGQTRRIRLMCLSAEGQSAQEGFSLRSRRLLKPGKYLVLLLAYKRPSFLSVYFVLASRGLGVGAQCSHGSVFGNGRVNSL